MFFLIGKAKSIIDRIVTEHSKGNASIAQDVRAKLTLKGINVDWYTESTPDDPDVIKRLEEIANSYDIIL